MQNVGLNVAHAVRPAGFMLPRTNAATHTALCTEMLHSKGGSPPSRYSVTRNVKPWTVQLPYTILEPYNQF